MPHYHYQLTNRRCSSDKLGHCEVCNKYASEMFYQVERQEYTRADGTVGLTGFQCVSLFGHESCLVGVRR